MPPTDPIDHDALDESVRRLRLGVDASELHGSLCGYLAGGGRIGRDGVLAALELDGAEIADAPAARAQLDALVGDALAALDDPELGFEPMLPADDRPLDERAESLLGWCRGFLGGFGLAGAQAHGALSEEAQEMLRDLATLAATEIDLGDAGEEEDALVELHEFVRVGAMMLYTETHAGGPRSDRVH